MMSTYYCGCCESLLREFLPGGAEYPAILQYDIVGMGRRENKNCPVCGSNDRERMVTLFLKKFILSEDFSELKMLHMAPEHVLREILAKDKRIKYVKGDNFSEGYSYPDTLHVDITRAPFEDQYFDFIICNHVLEHIEDDTAAIRELYRILKPGGRAILQVPISEKLKKTYENKKVKTTEMKIKYFGQRNHVRIYAWDYLHRLAWAGFQTQVFSFDQLYGAYFMKSRGLNEREKIIFCSKPL
ncbi:MULTISPECIES: class I SAM-dependent methyltransferase [unclassified Chryseobacterium]|uniref:class I SAM-dependent methyltransferase n=1 Tax=unclassified Chryseobacterium TaxID=2593645 RepID=UPI000D38977E|nr:MULTISPECIES: class I SAM-dependent methyltransferase [unclassified Chryseobacterium]PTT76547.1 SAM-dependent methyltransferase [Chryseobacterium sp. HMWF001]PVV55568.1 class I SAM-dependent methyltransferase [Chryseobacterium sp. HMWF035]